MRPRRCFRVALKAEGGLVGALQALQGAVEQADVGGAQVGGKRRFIDGETVVLAGDADAACVQIFDRMVGTVVAELHLEGFGTAGQGHDLVAEANAEGGDACLNQLTRGSDGVVARLGVARAVGEEDPSGLCFSTSAADVCAGTTVTLQPR